MKPTPGLTDQELEHALRDGRLLEDAPAFAIERARALLSSRAAVPRPGLLRRVLAALIFDSLGTAPLAYGMRGAGAADVRQLLYSAEGRDIDLRLSHDPALPAGVWRLSGQLLGPDRAGRIVMRAGAQQWEAVLDDGGEFHFEPVAVDPLELSLHLEDTVIELPPITLPRP